MAVRFDASGEGYSRNLALGSQSQLSVTCWVKISVDRNTVSTFWQVDSGSDADYLTVGTTPAGNDAWAGPESGGGMSGTVLTIGTWYFVGMSANGANGTMITKSLSAASSTVKTWTAGSASVNAAWLRLGVNADSGSFWFNGCLTAVKVWVGASLTQAEMENEMWSYMPRRVTGLTAWYPLIVPETADYSGKGNTLTGGTGTTTEDGPGIGWGYRPTGLYIPAVTAVTHELAAVGTDVEASTAAMNLLMPLAAVGLDTDAGAANLLITHALTAAGTDGDAGTATFTQVHALSASGVDAESSSANLALTISLGTAVGLDADTSSAELTLELILEATGTDIEVSNAVLYIALPYVPGPRTGGSPGGPGLSGRTGLTRTGGSTETHTSSGGTGLTRLRGQQGETHG